MANQGLLELEEFWEGWSTSPAKEAFLRLRKALEALEGVEVSFKARSGIT